MCDEVIIISDSESIESSEFINYDELDYNTLTVKKNNVHNMKDPFVKIEEMEFSEEPKIVEVSVAEQFECASPQYEPSSPISYPAVGVSENSPIFNPTTPEYMRIEGNDHHLIRERSIIKEQVSELCSYLPTLLSSHREICTLFGFPL